MARKKVPRSGGYFIDGLQREPPPDVLFHYTSHAGLLGLVAHKQMWASNIAYMNDASEFSYGEGIVREVLAERSSLAKPEHIQFFDEVAQMPSLFDVSQFFVACLTESGDQLSQWRGYTPNGNGFSIGFDSKLFSKLSTDAMGLPEWELVKCVYDHQDQRHIARGLLDSVLRKWDARHEDRSTVRDGVRSVPIAFHPPMEYRLGMSFLAPVFKDPAFAEEKEWRLIRLTQHQDQIKFREGRSMLIPYLEIDLRKAAQHLRIPAIRTVTVGPCPNEELARQSVQWLLASEGMSQATVKSSLVPFRPW